MTISTTTRTVTHNGNGVAVNFTYPFKIDDAADLLVYLKSGSVFVLKTLGTDYSLTGVRNPGGGTVTFVVAPASATGNVRFLRRTALTQLVDYITNDDFPAEIHEAALDKLTMAVQDYLGDSLTLDATGDYWDAESKVIKNVADPVDAQDAATKAYGEANWGGTAAATATTQAGIATTQAEAAAATPVAAPTNAAAGKATPVDADEIPLVDSAASWVLKKLTWANIKAALNSLYMALVAPGTSGNILTSNGSAWVSSAPANINSRICPIIASIGSNALTVTLNPIILDFRDSILSNGIPSTRTVSSAISVTVSNGSTLGTISGIQSRIAVLALDLGNGVVELAVVNMAGALNLDETTLVSTTAEGGSGGADSANVIYSTTARVNVPFRVVGYVESTQSAAGAWAASPSTVQGYGGQALAAMSTIGYGQTWQDVTASRAQATTYYNTTGKPIYVQIAFGGSSGASARGLIYVNGTLVVYGSESTAAANLSTAGCIVPAFASYYTGNSGGTFSTITLWTELR